MRIVIIGTGNAATVLGKKLALAGHRIVQVFGRDSAAASALAYELNTESTNYWNVVTKDADLYLIAVSDLAIPHVIKELGLPEKTIVHTAAAVSKDVFKGRAARYGVLYPLQSLNSNSANLPEVPIIIDASDAKTLGELDQLAHTISSQVETGTDEERLKLHLAAVFCNNFVNHLFTLMEDYCLKEGIDFSLLRPLIRETAIRASEMSPLISQTGPALRRDEITMQKHLNLLESYPKLRDFYRLFSESIMGAPLSF